MLRRGVLDDKAAAGDGDTLPPSLFVNSVAVHASKTLPSVNKACGCSNFRVNFTRHVACETKMGVSLEAFVILDWLYVYMPIYSHTLEVHVQKWPPLTRDHCGDAPKVYRAHLSSAVHLSWP
jgi:hypothetical protein